MIDLETITIAPIQETDAWKVCNFVVANEDRLKRFFPKTLEQNLTPTLAKHFVETKAKQYASKEAFLFTLKEKTSRTLVGLIYIKTLDWTTKQGEFAYCIGYPFERKGIASKAVKGLSEYAFETMGLKTLQIISHRSNTASVKVAEKCGFKWVKTLPEAYTPPFEDALDMELYELYNER